MTSLEALSIAVSQLAQWENLASLAIGITVGVIAGAIPGMSVTMAVALTLPFSFALPPLAAILLLLGVYKGGMFGGSIPAILINTPGIPASAATALDGYPLAQQGKAGKALSISLYASCIADLMSNLALIVFAAWLASLAMSFGSPEYFTLILFSLTIIAGVSGDNLLKGLFSAALGLLFATVGVDLVYGTPRFTFNATDLMGGLNFLAVLIGLFAIPDIVAYIKNPKDSGKVDHSTATKMATLAELRGTLRSIFRGSFIGVVLGSIPGIGAAPAAFLSYSEARRKSPNRERFGKGELEGVAAAEAGNNSVAGATLIPLLALGIPGDVITAIIIGAFMIHGLQPGPMLFESELPMLYSLFVGLIISSFLLLIVGSVAIRGFRYVTDIPKHILFPAVVVLCVFGVYSVNNSVFDIAVMFVFGGIGYLMRAAKIPPAPMVIAFVLGPLLEHNFRLSLLMSQGDLSIFFRGPITIIFWGLTFASLAVMIKAGVRHRREVGVE